MLQLLRRRTPGAMSSAAGAHARALAHATVMFCLACALLVKWLQHRHAPPSREALLAHPTVPHDTYVNMFAAVVPGAGALLLVIALAWLALLLAPSRAVKAFYLRHNTLIVAAAWAARFIAIQVWYTRSALAAYDLSQHRVQGECRTSVFLASDSVAAASMPLPLPLLTALLLVRGALLAAAPHVSRVFPLGGDCGWAPSSLVNGLATALALAGIAAWERHAAAAAEQQQERATVARPSSHTSSRAPSPTPSISLVVAADDNVAFPVAVWYCAYVLIASPLLLLATASPSPAADEQLPRQVFELPAAAFAIAGASSLLTLAFNGGTPMARHQAALKGYVAAVTALSYVCHLTYPGLGVITLPWGDSVRGVRFFSWMFSNPGLIAEIAALCKQTHGEWKHAAVVNVVMLVTGFCGLLACSSQSWLLAVLLLAASGTSAFMLFARMYGWFDTVFELLSDNDKPSRRKVILLRAFTIAVWCAFPVVQLLGVTGVSAVTKEVLWAVLDCAAKFVLTNTTLGSFIILREVQDRKLRSVLDVRKGELHVASLVEERNLSHALLEESRATMGRLSVSLSVIGGLSNLLLTQMEEEEDSCGLSPGSAQRNRRVSSAAMPRSSTGTGSMLGMSASLIKVHTDRLVNDIGAVLNSPTTDPRPGRGATESVSLHALLTPCLAVHATLLRPGVRLLNGLEADAPLLVANAKRVEPCLTLALDLANLLTYTGTIRLWSDTGAALDDAAAPPTVVDLHFSCEAARGEQMDEPVVKMCFQNLRASAIALDGSAVRTSDAAGVRITLQLPRHRVSDAATPLTVLSSIPALLRRVSSGASLAELEATHAPERRGSVRRSIVGRSSPTVRASQPGLPHVLCVGVVEDVLLLTALRKRFTLLHAPAVNSALHMLADDDGAQPVAVLLFGKLHDDGDATLNIVRRLRPAVDASSDPSRPIFVLLFGATETFAVTAAVASMAARAVEASVHSLSQLVHVPVGRSAMQALQKAAPQLSSVIGTVLDTGAPDANLPAAEPVLTMAHVATLSDAVAAAAVEEASDSMTREALLAGATATFVVPLVRSELVDHLVAALDTRVLAQEADTSAELLRKMLPERVMDRLKTGHSFYAEAMPSVSILFVDICQFTVIASMLEPLQIVIMLNELFSAFDELMLKYDVFKVESASPRARHCSRALLTRRVLCATQPSGTASWRARVTTARPTTRRACWRWPRICWRCASASGCRRCRSPCWSLCTRMCKPTSSAARSGCASASTRAPRSRASWAASCRATASLATLWCAYVGVWLLTALALTAAASASPRLMCTECRVAHGVNQPPAVRAPERRGARPGGGAGGGREAAGAPAARHRQRQGADGDLHAEGWRLGGGGGGARAQRRERGEPVAPTLVTGRLPRLSRVLHWGTEDGAGTAAGLAVGYRPEADGSWHFQKRRPTLCGIAFAPVASSRHGARPSARGGPTGSPRCRQAPRRWLRNKWRA